MLLGLPDCVSILASIFHQFYHYFDIWNIILVAIPMLWGGTRNQMVTFRKLLGLPELQDTGWAAAKITIIASNFHFHIHKCSFFLVKRAFNTHFRGWKIQCKFPWQGCQIPRYKISWQNEIASAYLWTYTWKWSFYS